MQKLDHRVSLRTVLFGDAEQSLHLTAVISFMLTLTMPNNKVVNAHIENIYLHITLHVQCVTVHRQLQMLL